MAVAQANISKAINKIVDGEKRGSVVVRLKPSTGLPFDSKCSGIKEMKSDIGIFVIAKQDPGLKGGFTPHEPDYRTILRISRGLRSFKFKIKLSERNDIILRRNEQGDKSEFDRLFKELKTELDKHNIDYHGF